MTDQEINTAIAKACGWKYKVTQRYTDGSVASKNWVSPLGVGIPIPNYTNDLNAMHEAEKMFETTNDAYRCINALHCVLKSNLVGDWRIYHATARQRAEAFLRVKGLWKD